VRRLTLDFNTQTALAMIPGTPTVVLNGESLSSTNLLLRQVCTAFATLNPGVDAPAGCGSKTYLRGAAVE
jgi:hypothetical protein